MGLSGQVRRCSQSTSNLIWGWRSLWEEDPRQSENAEALGGSIPEPAGNPEEFDVEHTGTQHRPWSTFSNMLKNWITVSVSSVAQSCLTLCDPMNHSTPGLPVHHQLPESTQNHVHWVSDAIQPSHPLSFPSPCTFNLSQHQGLLEWVWSLH